MFRRHFMTALGLLVAGAMVTGPALAQTSQDQYQQNQNQQTKEIRGTVVSVSGDMLVIRTDDGTRQTLRVDSQSTVPMTLTANENVMVTYRTDPNNTDRLIVTNVTMSDAQSTTQTQARTTDYDQQYERSRLPQTASPLPVFVLIGFAALLGFLALGRRQEAH